MENFVVSARKYRPSNFKSVVGQSHITTTLKNAIQNSHLAQAFLFCGPRGVGKTTCARILAKTVNCENITEDFEACNKCSSCLAFNNNNSMNIHELDAASNNSVDGIRNLVEQVRYAPQSGKYKIYIIDEVHMLSNAAFNAFLKTLEEPPNYALFILATTEKHKIIPTILSRCQIFDFNRIQVSDITNHLQYIAGEEGVEAEEEALHLIAQKADGALRDALSMFDLIVTFSSGKGVTFKATLNNLHILDYDYYFRITDEILEEQTGKTLLTLDEILKEGFDAHNFITGLSEHFRNLLVCKDAQTVPLMQVPESVQKKYQEQANTANTSFLLSALNITNQCDLNYKSSKNQRLLVELTLMKLSKLGSIIETASLGEVKKKSLTGSIAPNPEPIPPPRESDKPSKFEKAEEAAEKPTSKTSVAPQTPKVIEEAPEKNIPVKRPTPKTPKISLSSIDAEIDKPKEEKKEIQEEEITETRDFRKKELENAWDGYLQLLKKEEKSNRYNVLNREFVLEDKTSILLQLDNPVQIDMFEEFRVDFTQYLRKKLGNSKIQLRAELIEKDKKKLIYTQKEKYEHLESKNPLIKELKDRLGLDHDF